MDKPQETPLVDVAKVNIDNVNVAGAGKRDEIAQRLIALTPLLTVLATVIGVVFTFCYQIYQTKTTSNDQQDVEWHAALDKVSWNGDTPEPGAFQLVSFAEKPRYKAEARSIEATLLPQMSNKYEFDSIFFLLLKDTDNSSQLDIIAIARNESNRLRDIYAHSVMHEKKTADNSDLERFVLNPEDFLTEDSQENDLRQALDDTWKLDSTIHGLSTLWNHSGGSGTDKIEPAEADLSGIIFLNNHFDGVDFSRASMDDTHFVGNCSVDQAKFPQNAPSRHCQ